MPIVNGTLTDFGLDPLAVNSPELIFRASSTGLAGLNVLSARKAVDVVPAASGYFEADLVATTLISPDTTHYTVEIRYREADTGMRVSEILPWKLLVPPEGGALGDLLRVPANPALVWTGTSEPIEPSPGTWWLDPDTGQLQELAGDGETWIYKADLRGPAGFNATGAAEDDAAVAAFIAGDTETRQALTDVVTEATTVTEAITAVGDSLTDADPDDNWPEMLAANTGIAVQNFGRAGWASTDIAVYVGAVDPALTVTGNLIPASGAVTVTAITPAERYRFDGSGAVSWVGTLAGVPGTLRHNQAPAESWTFTRTTAGDAVACPPGSTFHDPSADAYTNRIMVLWAGRNNGGVMDPALRDTDLMIRRQGPAAKRCLVLSVINATTEIPGSTMHTAISRYNRIAAARYPDFFDIRGWMIANGLVLAGVSPTGTDRTDIANDTIPTSLRRGSGDTLHFSTAAKQVIARAVQQQLALRGWIAGLIPEESPGQVTGLTAGAATQTTQPLTWTATPGATAYKIESRPAGVAGWQFTASATGTAVTVTGLSEGTGYEYRVTAYNIAGPGTVSATLAAATTGTAPVLLASDTFNSPDVLTIMNRATDQGLGGTAPMSWTVGGVDQIGIKSNQLARTGLSSSRQARVLAGRTTGRLRFTIATMSTSTLVLVANWIDDSNYYRAEISANGLVGLKKMVAGVTTAIYSGNLGTVTNGSSVAITNDGATVGFNLNGAQLMAGPADPALTGTQWGVLIPADANVRLDSMEFFDK